ncbi:MAG: hypothetical protein BWY50_00296 [Spirochaetes bacterium ADurb.Bin315]|nr:MAG: hypothetical protein BWY50_00296 [Spirochaetes bacterium ADurb.Bin315]
MLPRIEEPGALQRGIMRYSQRFVDLFKGGDVFLISLLRFFELRLYFIIDLHLFIELGKLGETDLQNLVVRSRWLGFEVSDKLLDVNGMFALKIPDHLSAENGKQHDR